MPDLPRHPGPIIRDRIDELQLTRQQVADHMGVGVRQVQHWMAGTAQLAYPDQVVRLATLLGISIDEMTGLTPRGMDLSGDWEARWHTRRNGELIIDRHQLSAVHEYGHVAMAATSGNYLWRANCEITGYILKGTFNSIEIGYGNQGILYFEVLPSMTVARGHWMGQSNSLAFATGHAVLARTTKEADAYIDALVAGGYRNYEEWPTLEVER